MWQLIKRDAMNMKNVIIVIMAFILIIFSLYAFIDNLTPLSNGLLIAMIGYFSYLIFGFLFYFDYKNGVMRFIASLPVKKKAIVASRYLFVFGAILFFLVYSWLLDLLFKTAILSPIFMLGSFIFILFITAVSFIIFYSFIRYFWASLTFQLAFLLFLAFLVSLIDIYIGLDSIRQVAHVQPLIVLVLSACILLYVSYQLAKYIFTKTDIS